MLAVVGSVLTFVQQSARENKIYKLEQRTIINEYIYIQCGWC